MSIPVETIERATLAAVPSRELVEVPGWLLPLDTSTVSRTKSAVPLSHHAPDPAVLPLIEEVYRGHGLRPVLRLPRDVPAFAALYADLRRRGYSPRGLVLVMTGASHGLRAAGDPGVSRLAAGPDDAWSAVFLGPGFDPVDGAARVAVLRRGRDTSYASVAAVTCPEPAPESGSVVAVGCGSFAGGLVGVHGMRTAAAHRRHGHARAVLASIGAEAVRRGVETAYLQVEEQNAPAVTLYTSLGFTPAWAYEYWTTPTH
ncbi:GNAT family N-acetyltransferase [Propionicicella superfundia]|uniref:GNAT family N-acetyltransferase n=1 Tax=Propionicicella superfundia TaxID=348582 RepID=UPI001B7FCD30|nr:GNAT family N-acetyltransferase [Propionicicella superfundia]